MNDRDERPTDVLAEAHEQDDDAGGEGEADAPVGYDVEVNENDRDPTAGASDVGGFAGGIDEDDGAPGGSSRR